ncbi:MAG: DUF5050 domain-containing protein, partial [Clostridiales bacterium]|nr:DUF5050 domain-containing protein [Clostridiales bacterium]
NVQTSPANGTKAGDEISVTDEQVASDKSIHLLDFGMTEKKAVRLGNSHGNKANMGLICEYDGWIYYSDYNNDGYLAKMRPDGSDKQILLKEKCGYINLMNDYLYFKGEDGRIKRCRPDGSDLVSLTDKYVGEILVTSERIYFTSDCIEGIDLNGGNHERLTNEGKYYSLDIFGDYIFYTEYTDTFKIHAVKTDGSQQYLVRENARDGVILGNYLYYVDLETNRYCRFNLTTGKTESGSYGLFPHQVNDILYTNGKAGIYIYDNIYEESGMRLKKEYYFNVDIVLNFYLAGERIYVIIEDWHEREKVKDVYLAEINPDTGELIRIE